MKRKWAVSCEALNVRSGPSLAYAFVFDLVREMGGAYPHLKEQQTRIMEALRDEEVRFGETLENGMEILDTARLQTMTDVPERIAMMVYSMKMLVLRRRVLVWSDTGRRVLKV